MVTSLLTGAGIGAGANVVGIGAGAKLDVGEPNPPAGAPNAGADDGDPKPPLLLPPNPLLPMPG